MKNKTTHKDKQTHQTYYGNDRAVGLERSGFDLDPLCVCVCVNFCNDIFRK